MRTERHDVAFVVGALVGGLTAAAVTLFRAPQSGAQTRAQISERLEPITSKTGGLSRTVASQTRAVTSQSVAKSQELTTAVKSKVQSGDQPAAGQTDEFVVVEPLGTTDLEPLPAANAVPPDAVEPDPIPGTAPGSDEPRSNTL